MSVERHGRLLTTKVVKHLTTMPVTATVRTAELGLDRAWSEHPEYLRGGSGDNG
jgi:hypothetical protein